MPSDDEVWLDAEAGPVVRPYTLTQGRTGHPGESFDLVATVMATSYVSGDLAALAPEHVSVLQLARMPTTVADIASDLDLPLGVVRVIVADLRELGLVVISTPVVLAERIDKHTLREVLNGAPGSMIPPAASRPVPRDQDPAGRRLRRGQDHARRRGERDQAAADRGAADRGQSAHGQHGRCGGQDHHDGGDGLRPDQPAQRPGALPVRHAGPAAVLVHVGRAGHRRARRRRAGRHAAAGRQLPGHRLLRAQADTVHRGASTASMVPVCTTRRMSGWPWTSNPACPSSSATRAARSRPRKC